MIFQRHSLSRFETRSVALFAALAFTGAMASAQSTARPMDAPPATTNPPAATMPPSGESTNSNTAAGEVAFKRADTNGDQRLSRDEAKKLPVVSQNFERLDADKDGAISLAEFSKGVRAN